MSDELDRLKERIEELESYIAVQNTYIHELRQELIEFNKPLTHLPDSLSVLRERRYRRLTERPQKRRKKRHKWHVTPRQSIHRMQVGFESYEVDGTREERLAIRSLLGSTSMDFIQMLSMRIGGPGPFDFQAELYRYNDIEVLKIYDEMSDVYFYNIMLEDLFFQCKTGHVTCHNDTIYLDDEVLVCDHEDIIEFAGLHYNHSDLTSFRGIVLLEGKRVLSLGRIDSFNACQVVGQDLIQTSLLRHEELGA